MSGPALPAYGAGTLSDVLPSLSGVLGIPGRDDVLGLPAGQRFVLLLVDGLGRDLLAGREAVAPFLCSLLEAPESLTITAGAPSTTVTSITSLGTGLAPGQHGLAGYSFRLGGRLLNALLWEDGLDGLDVQPQLTAFERLAKAGVRCATVTPARFRGTGLTTCALRGADFLGYDDGASSARRVELTVQAALSGPRSLVYLYDRDLDHAGHKHGTASAEWLAELSRIDALAAGLRAALPDDVRLLVTGDHGMVDIAVERRITIEDHPDLLAGVGLIGGEGRFRQLYVTGDAPTIAARWADRLGEDAWVLTRDEASEAGWFGPVQPRLADRFGDVLVAMATDRAMMTRTQPNEFNLIGMHGSLTAAELTVPLLIG
ncbi:MAG: alkaline phosphatase family protein [Micropruina sp.]|uniref:alkaline phosphatase family protein n=1 Tax=Micropruina sp. TaxID=2737536 RepID=UPI0039E58A4F